MGSVLTVPIALLNFLLPFTRPGTSLAQDLAHTLVLCTLLYFGPQFAEWHAARQHTTHDPTTTVQPDQPIAPDNLVGGPAPILDPPLDERLVLQPDDDEDDDPDTAPLPLAPTPPQRPHQQPVMHPLAPQVDDEPNPEPVAGPANPNPNRLRATPANRTIGTKKAQSLARKDQRRAYHEWLQEQALIRRQREAEEAPEREAALAAERERRLKVEAEIKEREKIERETKKREKDKAVREEGERRDRVVERCKDGVVEKGAVSLVNEAWREGKDRVWAESMVRASGMMKQLTQGGTHVMITENGWLVKIDEDLLGNVFADVERRGDETSGTVSLQEFGGILEQALLSKAKA